MNVELNIGMASRKKYGDNVIPDSEPTTFWDEFKEIFNDPMIRILLVIRGCRVSLAKLPCLWAYTISGR